MPDYSTAQLQNWLGQLQAGNEAARDQLIHCSSDRLVRLTRKMLHGFQGVRRWEETGDVFQNAMLRLCRALNDVKPASLKDYFRLAAVQIRRELLDLARHYYGPQGQGAHHASQAMVKPTESGKMPMLHEGADVTDEPARLAQWTEFHRQVELLPDEEREVFDLLFYQGLPQAEAAAILGVTVRTVKSRWRSARLNLHEKLGGALPE